MLCDSKTSKHSLTSFVFLCSWVICEHSNYRGRQFLLEPIEIPNWPKFSSLNTIGSMYPVRQVCQQVVFTTIFFLFNDVAINYSFKKECFNLEVLFTQNVKCSV